MSSATNSGAGMLSALTQKAGFWEFAFIIALILLIFAHKITITGMIGAGTD
jgi:hypothetical protein